MLRCIGLLLGLTAAVCGQECGTSTVPSACIQVRVDPAVHIVNGQLARRNEIPWQVALINPTSASLPDKSFCGGTVWDTTTVLTAAHCVIGETPGSFRIAVNRLDMFGDPSQQIYDVAAINMHAGYDDVTLVNDIAVVKIVGSMVYSDGVRRICLPTSPISAYFGATACVSGWGTTANLGLQSETLRFTNLDVITTASCKLAMPGEVKDGMMCAQYTQRDSCQGDSGGPLVALEADSRFHQIGIVSWGYNCADPRYPGVYTEVYFYLGWIINNS